jgi:ABC-type transport system involved in multi-copper enzyme maturation permease subunit
VDLPAPTKVLKFNRLLPYWAVLQMDVKQTLRSWSFRIWIAAALLLSVGYVLHRAAIHHQAGILQTASVLMAEVLQFTILIGTTLVIMLTAGTISSERGTLADSVLSRGISRYSYFLGKWHARLLTFVGSFVFIGSLALVASVILLHGDLSFIGSALALLLVAGILIIVVSCGVTISSFCNSTVLGIAVLWMALYGVGVGLALLEYGLLNPARLLRVIPLLLKGDYDLRMQATLIGYCLAISAGAAMVGMIHFARRDV